MEKVLVFQKCIVPALQTFYSTSDSFDSREARQTLIQTFVENIQKAKKDSMNLQAAD